MAGNCWKLQEWLKKNPEIARNGCKLLEKMEMAGNGQEWLECLEMAGNG